MFRLFRKNKKYPAFETLGKFENKEKYFVRNAQWCWLDEHHVTIMDWRNHKMHTMDPWPQMVFLAAEGEMTVSEYVYYMAGQYDSNIPEQLDAIIIEELTTLVHWGVVKMTDIQQRPEKEFDKAATWLSK